jgi:large repetitive protein
MLRRLGVALSATAIALLGTLAFGGGQAVAAPTPISLVVPQGTAFSVLGYDCGGIKELAYLTGFDNTIDPSAGYPTGYVYLTTTCSAGKGTSFTVDSWTADTWDLTGALLSYSVATPSPNPPSPLSTTDPLTGNQIYDSASPCPGLGGTGSTEYACLQWTSTFTPRPRVTGLSTSIGPATGGTSVTIAGDGFTAATGVDFGSTPATFTVNSDTSITATAPASSAGPFDVTVVSAGGTSFTSSSDQFTFVAAPTITSLSPNSGPATGGTVVTITGTNLSPVTSVDFGGSLVAFVVNSDTSITAYPPGIGTTPDTASVTVTSIGGTSAPVQYTYLGACPGPCASVGDASVLVGRTATHTMTFEVTLSQPATTSVSVQYAVVSGTAVGGTSAAPGVDFKLKTGTLTFTPSGATGLTPVTKTIPVTVYPDAAADPSETFTVVLSNPTGALTLGRATGTGTILADDTSGGPTLGIGDTAAVVLGSGKASLSLPVTLSDPASQTISVSYSVTPGTATYSSTAAGGGNYGGKVTGTVTFTAGSSSKTISVPIWPSANLANDVGFTVSLSGLTGSGVTLIRSTGAGTILGSAVVGPT